MSNRDFGASGFTFSYVLQVLRRKKLAYMLGTVTLAAAGILGVAKLPNEYKATTTILVDPQKIPDRYVSATVSADPTERLNIITQEVLSTTRLQHTIEHFNLYPKMRATRSRDEVVEYMRTQITIQVKQSSGQGLSSFAITFTGNNPKIVADVTNQLAATFIEGNLSSREQQATSTTEFLDSQLGQAKQNLEQQESALRQFKMGHLGETPDELPANLQTLSRLQVQLQAVVDGLNRADTERMMLTRAPQSVTPASVATATPVDERTRLMTEKRKIQDELWDLQRKYTPSHPDVQTLRARLSHVEAQLAELPPDPEPKIEKNSDQDVRLEILNQQTARLHKQQHDIEQQIAMYQGKVDAAPVREQQLTELTRNYESSKQHYQSLLDKTFSAEMAADLERKQQGERFTILDPAQVPERPYKPKRGALMAAVLFGSFVLVGALLVSKEMMTDSIKSETHLKELLPEGAILLGTTRHIETPKERRNVRIYAALTAVSMIAICCATGFLLWKIHPIL